MSNLIYEFIVTTSFTSAAFGQGIGRIWMSGLTCTGTESSLFSCSSSISLGSVEVSTTCTHSNDVAVRCQGLPTGEYFFPPKFHVYMSLEDKYTYF